MNEIDPASRFSLEAARKLPSEPAAQGAATLNETALRIAAQYRRDTTSPVLVSGILRLVEFMLLAFSGTVPFLFHVGADSGMAWQYGGVILCASAVAVLVLDITDCYQMPTLVRPLANAGRLALGWSGTLAVFVLVGFFLKISSEFSRVWLGGWFVCGLLLMLSLRIFLARQIRCWTRDGTIERRAVIVGGGKAAEALIRSIEKQPYNDIRICGIFDDRDERRSPPLVAGYPKLGTIAELIEFARIARIDMLLVSLPLTAEARLLQMLKKLWVLPVDIRLAGNSNTLRFRPRSYSYIGAVPLLDILDKPINDWDSVAKRVFDIVFSLIGIVVFTPLMLATALAVKLDSKGPVLFKQKRHGFNNEVIEVYKFRSMYTELADPTAIRPVTKGDPRVTRVGRFIRKASIDELPQFFNVLAGSLSLVGPRPHAVAAQSHNLLYTEVVDGYFARHRVKPGVTGWAQINGWRGEMDTDEKIRMRTEFDLFYIENWSLMLDLKILLLTPLRLLDTRNAY